MTAQTLKVKRGTTAVLAGYTPVIGEPVMDTTTNKLKLGDGVTAGGVAVTPGSVSVSGDSTATSSFDSSGNLAITLTASPTGVSAGTYANVTVDAKGRVTAASTVEGIATGGTGATSAVTALSNLGAAARGANTDITSITGSAAKLTTTRAISLSGDATGTVNFDGSAPVTITTTLASSGVTAGTYAGVTVDAKGRVTTGTTTLAVATGGTGATTAATARTNLGVAFTAWTNLTLSNSWAVIAARRTAYRSFLDMVQLEVNISAGTATDGTVVGTLPVGYRPAFPLVVPVSSGVNAALASNVPGPRVLIGTDGTVACFNCTNSPGVSFSTTFATV